MKILILIFGLAIFYMRKTSKTSGKSGRQRVCLFEWPETGIVASKITRGHNFMLVKEQSRLDVRKLSFSQRTINVWNNLSTDCVHASSVNICTITEIDKYLVKAGYT